MVKSGSQRQKEYLKRLKEKNREEYLEKERKRKKEKLLLKTTDKQQYKDKLQNDRGRKNLQRAIRRQQVCWLFFELASVGGTLCGFQRSVLR